MTLKELNLLLNTPKSGLRKIVPLKTTTITTTRNQDDISGVILVSLILAVAGYISIHVYNGLKELKET